LVHYPYFDFFFFTLPLVKSKKTLVTLHDCTPLVFPENYPVGFEGRINFFLQKMSLKSVKAVLTDSENSKKDIIKYLAVPPEEIYVIYLAADPIYQKLNTNDLKQKTKLKYNLPEKFLLYVGDVNYNKNLLGLIKAFNLVKEGELNLVLVGRAFENRELSEVKILFSSIKDLNLGRKVRFLGFVPDEDLVSVYNLASVYCQPSFYEGFGLQILEAMACGCPVVTSNISSLPEIAGDAAVLVNPNSVAEIARGIKKLLEEKNFRDEKIQAGFSQAKKFSWDKTAEETIKVYEKLLEE